MSIKFYYAHHSTANATSAVLAELEHNRSAGRIAEVITLDLSAGDTQTESFLKVNPYGMVPVIVHDGVAIWESSAITIYLADLYGTEEGKTLYPPPGPRRGEAVKWIVWSGAQLQPSSTRFMHCLGFGGGALPKDGADEEGMRGASASIMKHLKVLDDALEGKRWLLGEQYALADTHVWTYMKWLELMRVDLKGFANISAWCSRLDERDVLKKWYDGLSHPSYKH